MAFPKEGNGTSSSDVYNRSAAKASGTNCSDAEEERPRISSENQGKNIALPSKTRPKQKNIRKEWIEDHCKEPYPDDIQKQELVELTRLTYKQVQMWFVNVRRRFIVDDTGKWIKRDPKPDRRRRGNRRKKALVQIDPIGKIMEEMREGV
eukprot:g59683.t1